MRILFDSKQLQFKDPFGTLVPGQRCTLRIHIPAAVRTAKVECLFTHQDGSAAFSAPLPQMQEQGAYEIFSGSFSFDTAGLYFYYFYITTATGGFRLFKYGDDTNMEDGSCWQLSCVPADFHTPDWSKGATIYQLFPDRFCRSGTCDLTGKLEPYTLHDHWDEDVCWQPNEKGEILNNDFFGGNFRGILEKMDYIASLGVDIFYLNPISKSFSNHRYDTGDYKQPDPMLGTMAEFCALCDAAHARNIRVILDGVYSHTGSNSLYFDKNRTFGENGAYCTRESPYYSWYRFRDWPDSYDSWWGFDTLPTVNKHDPAFLRYIVTDDDSVVAHWLRAGCDGFRLDVADELPSEFLSAIKKRIREIKPDALLLGEVWEDASNKVSYGKRCRYFVDGQLDSIMNYPFRTAIVNFLRGHDDGNGLKNTVLTIAENYPPEVFLSNMNLLSTHDSPRILTALADYFEGSREEKAARRLTPEQLAEATEKLLMASFIQYMLPGCPSLYYADEAGMEGHNDPFNRRPYPWGRENGELLAHFRALGRLRRAHLPLRLGSIRFFHAEGGRLAFCRSHAGRQLQIYVNRSGEIWHIPSKPLLFACHVQPSDCGQLQLSPMGFCVTEE